jgi:hypothetical protein
MRYPWWFIVVLLWAYVFFPFYPAMIIVYYHRNWKPLWVLQGVRLRMLRYFLVYFLSPVLYIFALVYFSIVIAEKCVKVLFDNKKVGRIMLGLGIGIFILAIPLVFVGVLLACGVGIFVSPLFGLYLVALGFFK